MQKKFLSHLILIVLLNLLVKPLAIFGIDAQVQNQVGAAEYGFYFSLLNFTYLFNILLDFGISNFNIKYIAQHPHLAKQYLGKIIPIRILLLLLYVVFSLGIAFVFGYNEMQFKVLGILLLNQFIISVILYLRSYFSGLLFLKVDIILSVLDKLFLILLVGYFLYVDTSHRLTILDFVWLQSFSLLLTAGIAVVLLLSKIGFPIITWNPAFMRVILKKSFPYALLIVLMMLYNRVDSVMLERIHPNGKHEAGVYAQAFRLLDAFVMFAMLFSSLLFPIFSKVIKDTSQVKSLLEVATNILVPGAIVIAGVAYFDWEFIIKLVYENEIQSSGQVFKILMFTFIPICITILFGTLLTVNGNLKFLNWFSFIGILVSFSANLFLIPKFGALGAAGTSLITQFVVALAQFIYVFKHFEIKVNVFLLAKYLGLIAILVLIPMLIQGFRLNLNKSLFMLILAFSYLIGVKLINIKSLVLLFKKG